VTAAWEFVPTGHVVTTLDINSRRNGKFARKTRDGRRDADSLVLIGDASVRGDLVTTAAPVARSGEMARPTSKLRRPTDSESRISGLSVICAFISGGLSLDSIATNIENQFYNDTYTRRETRHTIDHARRCLVVSEYAAQQFRCCVGDFWMLMKLGSGSERHRQTYYMANSIQRA